MIKCYRKINNAERKRFNKRRRLIMQKRINVTKSSMPKFEEYIEELRPVWNSRWLSNRGEASKKFENMLKAYLKTDNDIQKLVTNLFKSTTPKRKSKQ